MRRLVNRVVRQMLFFNLSLSPRGKLLWKKAYGIWDFLGLLGFFWDFLGFFGIFWDFLGFFGIFSRKVYGIFSSNLPLGICLYGCDDIISYLKFIQWTRYKSIETFWKQSVSNLLLPAHALKWWNSQPSKSLQQRWSPSRRYQRLDGIKQPSH